MQEIEIAAEDGFALAASVWRSNGDRVAVIAPGVGIRRHFYRHFAEYLNELGYSVVTYDHRGIGDSLREAIRKSDGSMTRWSKLDTASVTRWATSEGGPRLVLIGHSGGGQMLGMLETAGLIEAAVFVTAQSGYWRHWPVPNRYALAILWYVLMPLCIRVLRYFPARLFRLGENLPPGAAAEWSKWCRSPGYLFDHVDGSDLDRYRSFARPILSWSFSDDSYAPLGATKALLTEYPAARIDHRHRSPAELGLPAVGHFGFFRPQVREALWQPTLEWLDRHIENDNNPTVQS